MKKITLSLFTTIFALSTAFAQNQVVTAPPVNSSSQLRAPNGTNSQAGLKACYIVRASELANLTASVISSVGFSVNAGTGSIPVSGSFTLYLQNTTNTTYAKGTNWPTILTGMQTAYVGTYTVPGNAGASIITLPTNFSFGIGGGLYVAYEWQSNGPFAAGPATYYANSTLPIGGALSETPSLPTPDALTTNSFRPSFIFSGVSTLTNEIAVRGVEAPGKIAKLLDNTQAPVAYVKNLSTVTKTNIVVNLNVGGANTFTDTQTIPSLAAGAVGSVTFNTFASTVNGINNMSVSVTPDQVLTNNLFVWTQSVTCTDASFSPPTAANTFTENGYGFNGSAYPGGVFAFYYNPVNSGSVSAVRVAVFSSTVNIGKRVFAVVLDNTGNIVATGNTVTINAANFNTFLNLPFATPFDLTPSTDWYIGLSIEQPAFPVGLISSQVPINRFYVSPAGGGSLSQIDPDIGYLGIEGVFRSPAMVLTASSEKPLICLGESVKLNTTGGTTYTWSANTPSNTINQSSITVTPTNTGSIVYSVNATDGPSGCRTNAASVTQSVTLCNGIFVNQSELSGIKVFPNPAVNGKSEISGLSGLNTITVYNLLGQVVSTQQCDKENIAIDLSAQPNGAYLVKILDANKDTRIIKIVNQN